MKMSGFCVYLSQTFSLLNKVQLVLEDGVIAVVRQKKDSGYKKIEIRPAQPTGKEVTKHMSLACPNAKLIYAFFLLQCCICWVQLRSFIQQNK